MACSENEKNTKEDKSVELEPKNIVTEDYELIAPNEQKGLLILFPCFPCNTENTKSEFNISEVAIENNIAVLLMNFNQHLWLSDDEKQELESIILDAVKENNLNTNNIFIGGFSSGGTVSLLLSDYLKSKNSPIDPKGLFIVDSPIDLLGLYENAKKNIKKNFSEPAVQEAEWIVEMFDSEFGIGDSSLIEYEKKSPYLLKNHSLKNVSNLQDLKIRFYSEPDTTWWKENRQAEYEDMNAYYIEQLSLDLNGLYGEKIVAYIKTENRGFRANGDRHPHSWAIVDEEDLINWMLKK